MKAISEYYIKVVDNINNVVGYVLAAFLAIMSITIFWQVFSRYLIGTSIPWSEELARILMLYIVLLGSALALRKGQLLAVEVLPEILQKKNKSRLKLFVNLLSLFFYFILLYYGFTLAESVSGQRLPGLGISMFWFYFALSLGGFFLVINAVANILEDAKEVRS
ncbi:TRAP transporter small permease [Alkalicoccus saliphilus]|uniref:TRAP transporter small permease n=1 Tax=Alkalicoccus saliphilus TaxID=200989 RepID=A0A2T4U4N6_9BACI|nr:TRAP transporter small permease [Alkalicoccus saliphilus]PTL38371.1 TRAP transporter small permease [Alkalicoccus saliphilus]